MSPVNMSQCHVSAMSVPLMSVVALKCLYQFMTLSCGTKLTWQQLTQAISFACGN